MPHNFPSWRAPLLAACGCSISDIVGPRQPPMLSTDKTCTRTLGHASLHTLNTMLARFKYNARPRYAEIPQGDLIQFDLGKHNRLTMSSSLHEQEATHEVEQRSDDIAKRVLRKIDWRLIPLMFITYNLNFMDKTILSSASVFGLREDTVRCSFPPSHWARLTHHSICRASSTHGCRVYSTLATSSGNTRLLSSLPDSLLRSIWP